MFHQQKNFNPRDRFIPRRSGSDSNLSNYLLTSSTSSNHQFTTENDKLIKNTFVNLSYECWRKSTYQKRLESVMPVGKRKILNICGRNSTWVPKNEFVQDWPVRRRPKPVIGPPSKILDMPNINARMNFCQYLTDWSVKGTIASIFEQEIYLCRLEGELSYDVTCTNQRVEECVKWNRSGTHLAVSLTKKRFGLFNCIKKEPLSENVCQCDDNNCLITAMEWSSTNWLITGCFNGVICVWNEELKLLKCFKVHSDGVFRIALSSQERFLLSSGFDDCCCITLWPSMEPYFKIEDGAPLKGLAWHPWQESLLATAGYGHNGRITLFNVSSKQLIAAEAPSDGNLHVVDYLSFSPLTGELVVSYWNQINGTRNTTASISVLSNLSTLADSVHYHTNRVFHFLWADDGASLGTVSADETLCVWDFLGKQAGPAKMKLKGKKKYSLNPVNNLNMFGKTIR